MSRVALGILVAALSAAAVAADAPRLDATTQPHVSRFTDGREPADLDPVLVRDGATARLGQLAIARLLRYDRNDEPIPELATVVAHPSIRSSRASPNTPTRGAGMPICKPR